VITQLFSGLVRETPEGSVVPDVARSWEISEGGCEYVFQLRNDVRWSDGAPVTAGDFEYAWKRVLTLDPSTQLARLLYDIKGARALHRGESESMDVGVRALDDLTLMVDLEAPTGHFLQVLSNPAYSPVPRHVVEVLGEAWADLEANSTELGIVTNGPFRLESWRRGESMVLVRNPDYHGHFEGNLEQVKLSLLADPWAELEIYEADGLDVLGITFFSLAEMHDVRWRHTAEYVSVPVFGTAYIGFDLSRPPFDDVRVRRALVLAIDKETLAGVILRGYVSPATGGFVPPGMAGHSAGIGLPYDPPRARRLLAEAGHPDGRGFPAVNILIPPGYALEYQEYLQVQWCKNLGVEIAWETTEWATYIDRLDRESSGMIAGMWVADYPDPDSFLRVGIQQTQTKWQNKAYDALVEEAGRTTNQEKRMRLYRQADRILIEEVPIMPVSYSRRHLLVKPWVTRYPLAPRIAAFWKDVIIEPH
jgi:oligopeptide transport system substrate-binding protein